MESHHTRVVVADDQERVRKGIRFLLSRARDVEIVGEAGDGAEAVQLTRHLRPDVLLLDMEMPVMSGIEVAKRLRAEGIRVDILVLSAHSDPTLVREMMEAGAIRYLVKGESPDRLIDAIREAGEASEYPDGGIVEDP